jgi:hypothetical protein
VWSSVEGNLRFCGKETVTNECRIQATSCIPTFWKKMVVLDEMLATRFSSLCPVFLVSHVWIAAHFPCMDKVACQPSASRSVHYKDVLHRVMPYLRVFALGAVPRYFSEWI